VDFLPKVFQINEHQLRLAPTQEAQASADDPLGVRLLAPVQTAIAAKKFYQSATIFLPPAFLARNLPGREQPQVGSVGEVEPLPMGGEWRHVMCVQARH
jgi:hypothetical protein